MLRLGRHSALLVLSLAAQVSYGQWDTNSLWPSYEHPRGTFEAQLWQVYSGLVERSDAAGLGRPSPPRVVETNQVVSTNTVPWTTNSVVSTNLYDGLREILIDYKSHTSALIPYFLNMAGSDTNGTLSTNALWVNWTTNTFIAALCLPSNYFEVTHFRFLGGLGSLTNDATVGRSHGYTNAWTAAGGTNFPPGRTTWYSTDYGVDGLRVCLKNMRYRSATTIRRVSSAMVNVYEQGYDNDYWDDTWSTVAAGAEAGPYVTNGLSSWVNGDIRVSYTGFVEHKNYDWWHWNPSPGEYSPTNYWTAEMQWRASAAVVVTNMATNYPADIDVYLFASAHSTNIDYENFEDYRWTTRPSTFDDMDLGLGDGEWRMLGDTIPWDGTLKAVTTMVYSGLSRHPVRPKEPLPTLRAYTNFWPDWMVGFSVSGFQITNSAALLNYRFEFK